MRFRFNNLIFGLFTASLVFSLNTINSKAAYDHKQINNEVCNHIYSITDDIRAKMCSSNGISDCTKHVHFNSSHYNVYQGDCPGTYVPYDFITWWKSAGVSANMRGCMNAGGHNSSCWGFIDNTSGYKVNIADGGDRSKLGYQRRSIIPKMNGGGNFQPGGGNFDKTSPMASVEYNIYTYLQCCSECTHFPDALEADWGEYYSNSGNMRHHSGEYVNRIGRTKTRCNICHQTASNSEDSTGVCKENIWGAHLWYGDIEGVTTCFHCAMTLPAARRGSCSNTTGFNEVSLAWTTHVDKNDPEQNGNWVENIQVMGEKEQRQVVTYGGNITLSVELENVNKSLSTIATQCWWTQTLDDGTTTEMTGIGAGGHGDGGINYNYALPSSFTKKADGTIDNTIPWKHEYSIHLTNVTESNIYYQFHIRTIDGAVITSPKLYVDTTIIFFDYSADDNVENNELYYYKGNLLDDSGVLHSRDNVKPDAGNYNNMVQSRALIPTKTYQDDENDTKDGKEILPIPVLYYRYTLSPRTILPPKADNPDKTEDYLVSIDTLQNSILDYSVQMPTYFIENQFDLDDGFRTNTPSTVKGSDLLKAKSYNKYKATGITYANEDASNDRYTYDIFNVIRFNRWKLHTNPNKLLIAHPNSGKTADDLRGTRVKDDISPDNLGVLGLHWAEAVWEKNITVGSGGISRPVYSLLQLPKPERLFVLKLDTEGGEFVDTPENNEIMQLGTRYNNRVGTDSFDDYEDYVNLNQVAKGGTYNGANILKGYKGDYFTYRYNFGGWYNSDTYQPEYHVHEGDPSQEGGCYRSKATHKHTNECLGNKLHVHNESCITYTQHYHDGNSSTGGACYQELIPHRHINSFKDSNGNYVDTYYGVGDIVPNKGGCFVYEVRHVHDGSPQRRGTCYSAGVNPPYSKTCLYETGDLVGYSACSCMSPVDHVHVDKNGVARDANYVSTVKGGCFEQAFNYPVFNDVTYYALNPETCPEGGEELGSHDHRDYTGTERGKDYLADRSGSPTGAYNYNCFTKPYVVRERSYETRYRASCFTDTNHNHQITDNPFSPEYERGSEFLSDVPSGCFTQPTLVQNADGSIVTKYRLRGCNIQHDGYALTCDIDTNKVVEQYTCGLEGTVAGKEYVCGQTEGDVNGWALSCGMTENTIVGYTKVDVPVSPQRLQETDSEGYISTFENLDLMANWKPIHLDLPQVNKPGYVFLGWYTVPQSHIFPDVPTGGVLDTGAVYGDTFDTNFYEGFYAGAGYNPENYGKPNYEKDTKFLESSVNMNNPQNSVTLYAWYNRKPIYADLYEGLFFEGQDVSLKDLTRLVGVFDYEDDYYNEKLQQIYNLPEVDLDDIYLPVIQDTNEDYEEEEKDNNLDSDISTSNPKDNSYSPESPTGKDVYFDWSRWEKVTNLGSTTDIEHSDGESVLDNGSYGSSETDSSGKNPDGSDSNAVVQHPADAKTSKLDIKDGKLVMPIDSSGTRADGSTYSYTKGQEIDGVYRYIGDDAEYKDKIFFTVEAKEALETLIKGTSLDLRVKEVHYHVKDNKRLDTPEIVDFSSVPSDRYDDIIRQQEAVAGKYTHNGVLSTDAHVIEEHYRPVYGLDTSTSRLLKEAKTPENLPDVTKWYGDFDVVFQVTDRGILHGNTILEDALTTKVDESDVTKISGSSVTLEYKRKCRIQYNQRPLIYTNNLTLINDFSSSVVSLKKTLISNQIVIDAEDSQTNIPWWTYKMTMRNLEASLEIVGIGDFAVNAGVAKELDMTEEQLVYELNKNVSSLEELYEYKNSTDPIKVKKFRAITSFSIIFDAHDQFGKYTSGDVTPYRLHEDIKDDIYPDTPEPEPPVGEDPTPIDPKPIEPDKGRPEDPIPGTKDGDPGSTDPTKDPDGELEKDPSDYEPWEPTPGIPPEIQPNILVEPELDKPVLVQPDDFRKSTVYLIDIYSDAGMTNANVHEEIRFISSKYMGLLKQGGSYFGSVGYGFEKLESILNTKNTGSVKNTYSDPYPRMDGKEVEVTVYDYTE